jgi:hypothetical protein
MIKCALVALLGVLSVCLPVGAQQTGPSSRSQSMGLEQLSLYRPEILNTVDSSTLIGGLPILGLLDGQRLPISTPLGRMEMAWLGLSPAAPLANVDNHKTTTSPEYKSVAPHEATPLRLTPDYVGGEVGFFYGRSTGKFGGDAMGRYILGTTGNDKFQISVGASYEEWNGRIPRWAR